MATQKELARLAGVSSGTVSNVISGSTRVSERSRQKVLEAIRKLDYRPNLIARSLKTNRTRTLGMVVPDITIPFFPRVIRGAESAARERGYFLIVLDSESSAEREVEMIALLHAQRVEGILLIAAGGDKRPSGGAALDLPNSPMVCLDRLPDHLDVDSVCVDDRNAAEMGVSHLLAMGHTRIAVVTGPLSLENERERLRGYRQALRKRGIPIREELIWRAGFDSEAVARLCQKGMFGSSVKPTAIFSTNGVTGLKALRGLYTAGLRTPQDFAFVTFDELTSEDFFQPGITSVVQPAFEIGYGAVEVLLSRVEDGNRKAERRNIRLDATLIVRASSSAPLDHAAKRRQSG